MEVETREAASQLGVSQRQVQRMAQSGRLVSRRFAGRSAVARSSVVAAGRTMERGRRWGATTVAAAAELLEHGSTERITGSQRSRLRARLRTMTVAELAYHALGDRVTLWRRTGTVPASVSADKDADGLSSTGERLHIAVTHNASALARRQRLLEDMEGSTLLVELETDAPLVVHDIALFAYGDTRTSRAARSRIEARQSALS